MSRVSIILVFCCLIGPPRVRAEVTLVPMTTHHDVETFSASDLRTSRRLLDALYRDVFTTPQYTLLSFTMLPAKDGEASTSSPAITLESPIVLDFLLCRAEDQGPIIDALEQRARGGFQRVMGDTVCTLSKAVVVWYTKSTIAALPENAILVGIVPLSLGLTDLAKIREAERLEAQNRNARNRHLVLVSVVVLALFLIALLLVIMRHIREISLELTSNPWLAYIDDEVSNILAWFIKIVLGITSICLITLFIRALGGHHRLMDVLEVHSNASTILIIFGSISGCACLIAVLPMLRRMVGGESPDEISELSKLGCLGLVSLFVVTVVLVVLALR